MAKRPADRNVAVRMSSSARAAGERQRWAADHARRIRASAPARGTLYYGCKVRKTTLACDPRSSSPTWPPARTCATLDLHASQIQGFFNIPVDHLFAAPVIVRFPRPELSDLTIVSPDAGVSARLRQTPRATGVIDNAGRQSDRVMKHHRDVEGRNVFVVDDIIDTGGT
jgi:ribose-phosphate pyrophosphokinase